MAYRELGVIELREVWRRYSAGDGVRAIAQGTGVDRKTIAKYVAAAVAVGLSRGAPPPTDAQLAEFVRGLRGTPGGRPAALPERLASHQGQIAAWLADGLRLTKIHRRLREQGFMALLHERIDASLPNAQYQRRRVSAVRCNRLL